jgi:hypothetical protein
LEVVKSFAKHVALPKEGFTEYVKPMKYPAIMPAHIHAPNTSLVLAIKAAETNDFVEAPPFPNKVHENLLTYISNKSARRKCTPYDKIEMKPKVFIIKELNEENPQEVYLCDKGIDIKARYLSTPGARELGPSIDIVEIRDNIVYRHCNLY